MRQPILWALRFAIGWSALSGFASAAPAPDRAANVDVARPAFSKKVGPLIGIDGGHHNYHTMEDRFAPFAALLRNDGFRVTSLTVPFAARSLSNINILVIANALNAANKDRWAKPTPSAFTADEIAAVKAWVDNGGSLLLIADHFPFAGAAADLSATFGVTFINGFALRAPVANTSDVFSLTAGTLRDDVVTRGRRPDETVTTVMTFTGAAFRARPTARPVLAFPDGFEILMPDVAWEFTDKTPRMPAVGLLQGALIPSGRGRVAVFAEAAMFSAQIETEDPAIRTGFNTPGASNNKQLILNVAHWLARLLPM